MHLKFSSKCYIIGYTKIAIYIWVERNSDLKKVLELEKSYLISKYLFRIVVMFIKMFSYVLLIMKRDATPKNINANARIKCGMLRENFRNIECLSI